MPYNAPSVPLTGGTMSGPLTLPALLFETAGRLYAVGSTVYFRNAADNAYVSIDAADVTARTSVGTPLIGEITATGPYILLNTDNITAQNRTAVGNVPLIIKGMTGQTGDLQQWQDDLGTSLARLTSNGQVNLLRNAAGYNLLIDNPHATGEAIRATLGSASYTVIAGRVTGDAASRIIVTAGGKILWGSGAASWDTALYRAGVDILRTDDAFSVMRALATDVALTGHVLGEAWSRYQVLADGKVSWGSGGANAHDTHLYRSAAGALKTDGSLTVGSAVIVPIATKTTNYTLTATDNTILANAALTATLPSAVTAGAGRRYVVKNIHASATVTLASTAGTIDGAATLSIASMEAVTVISDGANWWAV